MKKRILNKIFMALIAAFILLPGCGEQQAEDLEKSAQNSEVVPEVEENIGQDALFSGTIFDNLVMGETTTTDVEKLLEDRILEYEYESVPNAIFSLSGKTTITDEFCEWNALYKYILVGSDAKEDYKLTDWTVELLLNEDDEYKDAVKYIQNVIDENVLEKYATVEATYSDDMVQGDVIYYPIEKFTLNDVDGIKYIMFGKYANCDLEEAKHIIVLSVGIVGEEEYQKGEIEKIPTLEIQEVELEGLEINEEVIVSANDEMEEFQNIAFFITDKAPNESSQCRSTSIISFNPKKDGMKIINISRSLYLNVDDKYNRYSSAYMLGKAEQAIKTLNMNLDMNIQDFMAIDLKGLAEFVDVLGGVWIDVPQEIHNRQEYSESIKSLLGVEEDIILSEGKQLLDGNQLATYIFYAGNRYGADQIIGAIGEQMQSVDKETLKQAIDVYTSKVYTSLDEEEISELMKIISDDNVIDEASFPQENMREALVMGSAGSCVVPTDLEANVIWLHQFLFGQDNYEVSNTVKEYSSEIKQKVAEYKAE